MEFELEHSDTRPECPQCGLDLVLIFFVIEAMVAECWMCDCGRQEEEIRQTIIETRNHAADAASVIEVA